ncbi:hypothetical protein HMPREF0262_02062 [Clostridium sp. ATCC 29733]|nr:hypothetical protein HMPREF0262_02062 [Clostridium sp. ATCC 29733]
MGSPSFPLPKEGGSPLPPFDSPRRWGILKWRGFLLKNRAAMRLQPAVVKIASPGWWKERGFSPMVETAAATAPGKPMDKVDEIDGHI